MLTLDAITTAADDPAELKAFYESGLGATVVPSEDRVGRVRRVLRRPGQRPVEGGVSELVACRSRAVGTQRATSHTGTRLVRSTSRHR
jgi:hypothetical protein